LEYKEEQMVPDVEAFVFVVFLGIVVVGYLLRPTIKKEMKNEEETLV
jgi:hypothetical protein